MLSTVVSHTAVFGLLTQNSIVRRDKKAARETNANANAITNFIQEQMIIPCVCCLQSGNCHLFLLHELRIKTC